MFKYRIRNGKHTGVYNIYTLEEAKKYKIKFKEDWLDCEVGEWGMTDDGYVVQLIEKYRLINRRKQITLAYRFPFIMIPVTYDVEIIDEDKIPFEYKTSSNKVVKTRLIYDILINNRKIDGVRLILKPLGKLEWRMAKYNRSSFKEGSTWYPKRLTARAKLFVEYIKQGLDPITAYMRAFNYFYANFRYIKARVFRLLESEAVQQHLIERGVMDDFVKKLKEKGITEDFLIDEIKKTITDNKVSSQVRASMIALVLKIMNIIGPNGSRQSSLPVNQLGELPPAQSIETDLDMRLDKRLRNSVDADYEEVDSEGD